MPKDATSQTTYRESLVRESLVEYLFLGALLKAHWPGRIEVSKPRVDDSGYDLILEARGIVRHVQLKGSFKDSKTRKQKVHARLAEKPSGCVIWIVYDSDFNFRNFRWFGDEPGERLPDLSEFPKAKKTGTDADGNKRERSDIYEVGKRAFKKRTIEIEEVSEWLFG